MSASFGLASDEVITRRQGTGKSVPIARLYTYGSHCAPIGRFRRPGPDLRLDECRRLGVEVNRRPAGGGAFVMGADQLGVAIMQPTARGERLYERTRELFGRFSAGIIHALARIALDRIPSSRLCSRDGKLRNIETPLRRDR